MIEFAPDGTRRTHEGPVTLAALARARHGADLAGYDVYSADLSVAASVVPTAPDAPPRVRIGRVGRRPREFVPSRAVDSLAVLAHDRAWGWWRDDRERTFPLRVDLTTGAVDLLSAPEAGCREDTRVLAPDGTLLVVAGEGLLRVGSGGLERFALPEGASRIAFHDARRGMAYGERLDRVWLTRDGGHACAAIETHAPDGYAGATGFCHAGGCSLAGVMIEGWDASRLQSHVVEATSPRPTPAAPWMAPWAAEAPPFECHEAGPLDLPPWTRPSEQVGSARSPAGEVRVSVRAALPQDGAVGFGGRVWSVEWRGVDAEGTFRTASPERLAREPFGALFHRSIIWDAHRLQVLSLTRERLVTLPLHDDGWSYSAARGRNRALHWVALAPDRARFVPADERLAGESVSLPSPARLTACAGRSPPGSLRVVVQTPASSGADRRPQEGRPLVTLEFDDVRACVRGAQGVHGRDSRVWAAGDGFGGVAFGATGAVRLRCSLAAR